MIKGLSPYESVVVITAWRYTLGATLVIVLWFIFRPTMPGWSAVPFHVFRGFFQISAASLFFWSVTQIPLATAAALGLTGTLMIGPLAWLLMREPLKRNVIGGTLVGFAGALFIVNTEIQSKVHFEQKNRLEMPKHPGSSVQNELWTEFLCSQ